MKRTVSVVYTVFVIVALIGILGFFGWKTYESRAARIADLESRADDYTRRIARTLTDERDVESEVALAEKFMADNPSLVLVQVYSYDDGLRLSVVKPVASDYSRKPLLDTDKLSGLVTGLRYHKVSRPLQVPEMQGMEAVFLATTLSDAEVRGYLMIILIAVVGLFAVTLVMILVTGRSRKEGSNQDLDETSLDSSIESDLEDDDFSLPDDFNDDFDFSDNQDINDSTRLDENDLLSRNPEFGESLLMDDDFTLPELDDESPEKNGFIERLDLELERAASFNQDLSLLVFSAVGKPGESSSDLENSIRRAFPYKDLVFDFGGDTYAVIEINKDLDSSLAAAEDFILDRIERVGNRALHVGIASRNGRLISAARLHNEAESALGRTDASKNIVAFRSDPEKYRDYVSELED